uniref:BY PROTMAP: gi/472586383/gb/EMS23911.1/ diacylglycerol kinase [Rhodosporidium toruloides NP11] gi/647397529/emb/CDR40609.1/ RHTO0S05e05446g1_1 [Rhodosporidium toruloides] n=1 Tax=Rhodotorula toruloides TaxID=5286 RepID=A0A0K3CNL2_RHOTO
MSNLRQRAGNGQATAEDKVAQKPLKAPEGIAVDGDRVDKGRWRSGCIPRKLLHSSIALVVLYLWLSHPNLLTLLRYLAYATTVIATADVLRFRFAWFERAYEGLLGYFMRESERHAVNGTIYYLVGVLWCLALYPRGTLAAIGVGMAASYVFWSRFAVQGDEGDVSWVAARVASSWRGRVNQDPLRAWGIRRLPNPQSTLDLHTLVVVNGLTAGLAEAIDFFGFDDNLSLPVLFGFFCWLSMYILG